MSANNKVYKIYWGALFATLITWIFALVAVTGNGWMSVGGRTSGVGFSTGDPNCISSAFMLADLEKACSLFKGARACQVIAILLVSAILLTVVYAAFKPAPASAKFGPIVGISLLVFSVIQLITFALMAAYIKEYESFFSMGGGSIIVVERGATFGVAVMAFIFGFLSGVVTLVLYKKVVSEDGPVRKFQSHSSPTAGPTADPNAGPTAGPEAGPPPAYPTAGPTADPKAGPPPAHPTADPTAVDTV